MENDLMDDNESTETLIRWVSFKLGSEVYGVEVKNVREILRINEILPVPGAADYVVGITNIRGNVVSVIDGRKRMNLPAEDYTDVSRMIVMESEQDIVAVIVDKVTDIIDLPESMIDLNPKLNSGNESQYISGVISHPGGLMIILDGQRFITDEQLDMVAGF